MSYSHYHCFSFFYLLFLFLGYGGVSPHTQWGRIAALVYALFGIPIILLYLSAMGEGLSSAMRCVFRRARSRGVISSTAATSSVPPAANSMVKSVGKKLPHETSSRRQLPPTSSANTASATTAATKHGATLTQHYPRSDKIPGGHGNYGPTGVTTRTSNASPSLSISLCVMILIGYILAGTVLFHKIQNWSTLESLYFCFTALGTIGFGELAPSSSFTMYVAFAYILVGMTVVAMCFSLIQTELVMWLRRFGVQDHIMPQAEEIALVSVAVTPKSS